MRVLFPICRDMQSVNWSRVPDYIDLGQDVTFLIESTFSDANARASLNHAFPSAEKYESSVIGRMPMVMDYVNNVWHPVSGDSITESIAVICADADCTHLPPTLHNDTSYPIYFTAKSAAECRSRVLGIRTSYGVGRLPGGYVGSYGTVNGNGQQTSQVKCSFEYLDPQTLTRNKSIYVGAFILNATEEEFNIRETPMWDIMGAMKGWGNEILVLSSMYTYMNNSYVPVEIQSYTESTEMNVGSLFCFGYNSYD